MKSLLQETLDRIEPVDAELMAWAQQRLDNQTKPPGSLGRLEECARRVVAITRQRQPSVATKVLVTLGGDHGVVEENVSRMPPEVTIEMMKNFAAGGAGINVLGRHAGAELMVVDLGVNGDLTGIPGVIDRKLARGTANIARGPAMDRALAKRSIEVGIEIVDALVREGRVQLLGTGEMGIANSTPSAAIVACLSGRDPAEVTGRGTGVDDATLAHKIAVVRRALDVNAPDPGDPIDVLSKVGGLEIGGLAGLVLGAAKNRLPVVVDGFISTAGALLAHALCPASAQYMFASHRSVEVGHTVMLERLDLRPLLDLDLRLGEGTGAALAMFVIEAGVKVLNEMAIFEAAGVTRAVR
ncbi:MAG: nicotinate-nucleotide--dimethylbenzimidazole phosphoribosyltransferase [Pseudomonadota bacterium]